MRDTKPDLINNKSLRIGSEQAKTSKKSAICHYAETIIAIQSQGDPSK